LKFTRVDLLVMLCLFGLGLLPIAAARVEGYPVQGSGCIALALIYFVNAPLGVRGFLNAVFVNITRRTEQQEFLGALLSGGPSMAGRAVTPRLVRTEHGVAAWLDCRAVLLRSFAGIQRRTEAMAAIVFLLCIGLFGAVAVPAFTSEERVPLRGNAFLLLLAASLIMLLGSFAVAISFIGDRFNHLAVVHVKELAKLGLERARRGPGAGAGGFAMATLLAQEVVRTTQAVEPLSVLGLIELNISSARAVFFFMTIDLGIVFSRVDWSLE
jgi:hypothetical protein